VNTADDRVRYGVLEAVVLRGGVCGLRCWSCFDLEKTFERLVHLPQWLHTGARHSRLPGLAKPSCIFFARAVRTVSSSSPAFYSNHRQLELLYSAGDSENWPRVIFPLIKPSSRGPPQQLP
jgi:hypothetical protein